MSPQDLIQLAIALIVLTATAVVSYECGQRDMARVMGVGK